MVNGFVTSAVAALGQPAFASSVMATPDMICPDVQNPHWNPSCSMNVAWTGWSSPSCSSPSMVVIRFPSCITAKVMQDRTRRPSTWTVHAPHSPLSQPLFVPVSDSSSRSASSRVMRGSTMIVRAWPFTVTLTR
jgi:hypothetical protein